MPVPQSFMSNASVTRVNLFIYQIGFYAANLEECVVVVNYFEPHSIHIRLCDITNTSIFMGGTCIMVNVIFRTAIWHKYGYNDHHSHNFGILT